MRHGTYPYDASKGTMQLMLNLMEDKCPLPEGNHTNMSEALKDFIRRCMHKNPLKRPTATELLRHPFVIGEGKCSTSELRAYMRSMMLDRDAQIHDASLIMTWKFYNNLSNNAAVSALAHSSAIGVAGPMGAAGVMGAMGSMVAVGANQRPSGAGHASSNLSTSGYVTQSSHVHSHMTSTFFDVGVTLKSSAPPTSPSNMPSQITQRGQYTVAAHFHDMIRQIGPKACFGLTLRRMKYKEKEGSNDGTILVNIMQRVQIFDCPANKAKRLPVGVYEESLVVEVTSIDNLVPGKGFRFVSIEALWTTPLECTSGAGTGGGMAHGGGCKTQ